MTRQSLAGVAAQHDALHDFVHKTIEPRLVKVEHDVSDLKVIAARCATHEDISLLKDKVDQAVNDRLRESAENLKDALRSVPAEHANKIAARGLIVSMLSVGLTAFSAVMAALGLAHLFHF